MGIIQILQKYDISDSWRLDFNKHSLYFTVSDNVMSILKELLRTWWLQK